MPDTLTTPGLERTTMVGSIDAMNHRTPSPGRGEAASPARTVDITASGARTRDLTSHDTMRQQPPARDALTADRLRRASDMVHLKPGAVIPGTRYRLLRWLGDGGMGVVYEAEHIDIERRVAVKILRLEACDQPLALQLFRDEARAAGRIGSAHIVEILDFAELSDGRLLYTMELLGGRPLTRDIAERPLSAARTIGVLRQICKGLASAHAAHIIHRDIKPDNINLSDRQGRTDAVKILDFGISIFMAGTTVTDCNILGTPLYLAPEIIAGLPFDARVDIYAVGCTAYEMLTGRPPYEGNIRDLLFAHCHAPLPSLVALCRDHDVPRPLADVILRCLAKVPQDRYDDMNDLEAALCEAQIAARLETPWDDLALPDVDGERRDRLLRGMPDPATSAAQVRPRRRRYLVGALVGCLVLGGLVVHAFQRQAAVAAATAPEIIHLEAEARRAAAHVAFVYPLADHPRGRTSYQAVLELERLDGANTRPGRELAGQLRREFAGTLGAFGDRLWDRPGGREFAIDAYAQALLFNPDLEPAAARADLTPGQLARLATKAAASDFSETELIAIEPLIVLAEVDIVPDTPELQAVRDRISRRTRARDSALLTAAIGDPSPRPATAPASPPAADARPGPDDLGGEADATAGPGPPAADLAGAPRSEPSRDPAAAARLLTQARAAARSGQLVEAERLFERSLAHDSRNVDALAGLAELHFNRGAYARAANLAERASKLAPKDAALHLLVGDAAFKVFHYDDARAAYERARALHHPEAERRLAKLARLAE